MGKKRQRRANKRLQEADGTSVIEEIAPPEDPKNNKEYQESNLIDPQTYASLANEMLRKPPADRNVFISMKDYELKEVTAKYKYSPDAPTNLVVFCLRLIRNNLFQPILVLQRYDTEDQSYIIANCLKAIIRDLATLGLYVTATISPPTNIFRNVLNHLVDIPNLSKHKNYITYASHPFREILHLYDIDTSISSFQNLFFYHQEVSFIAENVLKQSKWEDVQYILESNKIDCKYAQTSTKDYIIFNEKFQMATDRALNSGKPKINNGIRILINLILPFANIRELERNSIQILDGLHSELKHLRMALSSMHFRVKKEVNVHAAPFSHSRNSSNVIEIAKAEMDCIMETIDKSIEKDKKVDILNINKNSLIHVVKDHLSESQKNTLINDYNVNLSDLTDSPKNFSGSTDNLSISSGDFDFQINDMSEFFGAIMNFKDNNNITKSRSKSNNESQHKDKNNTKKKAKKKTEESNGKGDVKTDNLVDKSDKNNGVPNLINTNNKHRTKDKINVEYDNNSQNNEENVGVDVQDYIKFLRQSCDSDQNDEPLDFELKAKIHGKIFDVLKENYMQNRLTNDWLSTIQALPHLRVKLYCRRVKEFLPLALTLVHSDYFVNVVQKRRNGLKTHFSAPDDMAMLDYNAALSMLTNSLYLIEKN